MKNKQLQYPQIIILILLFAASVLCYYFFKISSIFLIIISILVGFKTFKIYDKIYFLLRFSFIKICIANILLFLWFVVFFGMFFKSNFLYSSFGNSIALFLKKIFGSVGSILFLFSPIIYFGWNLYQKYCRKNSNQSIPKPSEVQPQQQTELQKNKNVIPVNRTEMDKSENENVNYPYQFPTLDLLTDYPQENPENMLEEVENKKQLIKQTLGDFGIKVIDIMATIGATVTLYELILARGVSANKIKTIDEDIARNLKVQAVRIISPFKDRGTVALEVPNNESQIVGLKNILGTVEFQHSNYELPLALGMNIDNTPQIIDLAEMPHILIGGATNQGKSVGLNAMIASLLYKKTPEELKLVLIDPKLTELTVYEEIAKQFRPPIPDIKHFIITDNTDEISETLQALCNEMRQRLILFQKTKCRNIKEYNAAKQIEKTASLSHIVVFIDEFAEIIKNKTIKESIILLARQARAAGIHLVVATQRPSASAISGDITANFPARIAFKVIKWQNSDIILGESGAEKLIGKGDMLFSHNSEMERLQGAFVSTDEIGKVTNFIAKQKYNS